MKSKKRNYTHTLYNTETFFNKGLIKEIRTNRYLGILLEKGLIFPILIRRRNYPDDTWVFMLVVVCQMGVFVRTPTPFGVKTSGIFLILNRRRFK
jgi:hypothetical protein